MTASTIEVFPAWPKDWAVNFKLLARGGTMVTAAQQGGKGSGDPVGADDGRHDQS